MRYMVIKRGSSSSPTTELGMLVESLGPGQNALLADTGLSSSNDQYNWTSRFFYDAVRGYAIATGKHQSPDTLTWIGQFSEASNAWTGGTFQFPQTNRGHVYEGLAYAPATGVAYFLESGGATDRIAVHAPGDAFNVWTYIGQDPETKGLPSPSNLIAGSADFVTDSSSLAHHPGFYGAGAEGLLVACQFGFAGYRISNDTYTTIISKATWTSLLGTAGGSESASLYCAGLNAIFFSAGNDGNILWKMDAGGTVTRMVDTVIRCGPDDGGGPSLKLVDDPEGGPTFYGLESAGTRRVFKFNPANSTLENTGTFHPFVPPDGENMFFASCKPTGCTHGAIWGIEESTTGWRSRIYVLSA